MRNGWRLLCSVVHHDLGQPFGRCQTSPSFTSTVDARLLFVVDKIPKHERDRVRRDLLDYCHPDALAMVRLVENLEGLARVAP
jgi:hypothetical protein